MREYFSPRSYEYFSFRLFGSIIANNSWIAYYLVSISDFSFRLFVPITVNTYRYDYYRIFHCSGFRFFPLSEWMIRTESKIQTFTKTICWLKILWAIEIHIEIALGTVLEPVLVTVVTTKVKHAIEVRIDDVVLNVPNTQDSKWRPCVMRTLRRKCASHPGKRDIRTSAWYR